MSPRISSKLKTSIDLLGKVIFPSRCHGKLGGKSAGLFLAKKIIDKAPEASQLLRELKVPKTWYVTSDWIQNFMHHNDLEDVLNRKYMEIGQVRQEYPHLVALFKSSSFPSELAKGLALALEDLGDVPLIVRSSSLLEDRPGSAFSGKYKSLFLGNRGHQGRASGRADGRYRGSLRVHLRPGSHRISRRAGVTGRARRDGHYDPGGRRPCGRKVFPASLLRSCFQQ